MAPGCLAFEVLEPCGSGTGALVIGGRSARVPGAEWPASTCAASITASAVLPAAAAMAGTAAPAPLAALAQQAEHHLVWAAASCRAVFVQRGSSTALRRRQQPTAKRPPAAAQPPRQQRRRQPPSPAAAPAAAAEASSAPVTAAVAGAAAAAAQQQQQQLRQARAVQQFLAGGVAGAVSKTLVAPLERISTMLMADARRFTVAQAARHAWRDGLYRGHAATLLKIFPASAVQFAVFSGVKDRLLARKAAKAAAPQGLTQQAQQQQAQQQQAAADAGLELENHERLMAGAAAGAAAASLCYPLESLRTFMSVAGGVRGNLLQAGRAVVASHGVGALYKGFRASLVGDVMGNALGFTLYEMGSRLYRDWNGGVAPPPHLRGVIGTLSAACVLTLTLPLEVVRRRLQVQGLAGRPILYRGTLDCIHQVLRREGLAGFYGASLPSYLKVAPSIGCMYFLFELLMSRPLLSPPPPPPAAAEEGSAAARA